MARFVPLVHPWIDASRAPIYRLTFPERTTDDELQSMFVAREAWAKVAKYPVSWVVDLSNLLEATAKQRRLFGDHLERFEPHDLAWNRGSALVVPNTFLRGLVTAVFWIKPPKFPHELFPTADRAWSWSESQLAGSGATAPSP